MIEGEAAKLAAGAAGSGLGVYLARAKGTDGVVAFLGGLFWGYILTPLVVDYFNIDKYTIQVASIVSMLSMMFMKKLYSSFARVDEEKISDAIMKRLNKILGGK